MEEFDGPRAGAARCPPHGFPAPPAWAREPGERAHCFWCRREFEAQEGGGWVEMCPLVRLDWHEPPHGPRCTLEAGHAGDHAWEYEERRK